MPKRVTARFGAKLVHIQRTWRIRDEDTLFPTVDNCLSCKRIGAIPAC